MNIDGVGVITQRGNFYWDHPLRNNPRNDGPEIVYEFGHEEYHWKHYWTGKNKKTVSTTFFIEISSEGEILWSGHIPNEGSARRVL